MLSKQIDDKRKLILDIENLLNSYENLSPTYINPSILEYMEEEDLKKIISELLHAKETTLQSNASWLEQFKKKDN